MEDLSGTFDTHTDALRCRRVVTDDGQTEVSGLHLLKLGAPARGK